MNEENTDLKLMPSPVEDLIEKLLQSPHLPKIVEILNGYLNLRETWDIKDGKK
ncbi:hypothetical protein [Aurantibacillus circumpalustris]|uniref:hypothetical protein n=1 Tax=Aurantibacillus circumpalustris TaxID=3036359 RepID=UPI00295A872E|nr:hypothetical protein [Aurantibacillus circumpalustris]